MQDDKCFYSLFGLIPPLGRFNFWNVWQRCKQNEDISIGEDSTHSKTYTFRGNYLMRDSYMNQSKVELSLVWKQ